MVNRKLMVKTGQKVEYIDLMVTTNQIYSNLRSVRCNSIFCLGLFLVKFLYTLPGFNLKAKYFALDPVTRYISLDNLEHGDTQVPDQVFYS